MVAHHRCHVARSPDRFAGSSPGRSPHPPPHADAPAPVACVHRPPRPHHPTGTNVGRSRGRALPLPAAYGGDDWRRWCERCCRPSPVRVMRRRATAHSTPAPPPATAGGTRLCADVDAGGLARPARCTRAMPTSARAALPPRARTRPHARARACKTNTRRPARAPSTPCYDTHDCTRARVRLTHMGSTKLHLE